MERTTSRLVRTSVLFALVAMLLAGFAFSAQDAHAAPNGGNNKKAHQLRGDNFAEGCGNAGGKATILESNDPTATHVRCDMGDYAVSCVFTDQHTEKLDVCVDSRGIQAAPGIVLTGLSTSTTNLTVSTTGTGTKRPTGSRVSKVVTVKER